MAELNESVATPEVTLNPGSDAVDDGAAGEHADANGTDGDYGLNPSATNEDEGFQQNSDQFNEDVLGQKAGDEPAEPVVETPKVKAPSRIQERLDTLTARAKTAEQRALAAEAELEAIKATGFDPAREPQEEEFETYKEFVKATAKWEAQKAAFDLKAADVTKHVKEFQGTEKEFQESKMLEGMEAYTDFAQKMVGLGQIFTPKTDAYHELFHSDQFTQVGYYLANNLAEAARIAQLSGRELTKEILRLEQKFEQGGTPEPVAQNLPKPTPKAKVSQAPAPARQVLSAKGGQQRTVPVEKLTMEQYAERRQKQLRGK